MPSTTSSSVSKDFASSTVITPSLPTFFIASARNWPISASPFAEIVPTCAISWLDVTFFEFFCKSATTASTARSTPRVRSIGVIPAATALEASLTMSCARNVAVVDAALEVPRVHTGGNRLEAFLANGLRENRCGGRTIAGEVRGLRRHLSHHFCAHVLELVFQLHLPRHSDTVLGDARRAERLVEHDIAALGTKRHADCVGEDVYTAQHPVARVD